MEIIDLTKTIYEGMEVYPGDPEVKIEQTYDFSNHEYLLQTITMGSHTGTHVDAFSHMDKEGKTLDDIELDKYIGFAVKVNPNGYFPTDKGLVFEKSADIDIFDKIKKSGAPFVAGNISYELEKKLLNHQIVTYTNLINLGQVPENTTFLFVGLPLKIKEGDGSPVRAIAILDL